MTNQVPYADIVDKETDGENAALLINDTKRAINELIVDTDASFKSFDSLTSAIAFVTANPSTIERLSTASYRDEAECLSLGIDYPDGGGADYTVVPSGAGIDDGGSFIDAGTKQLKLSISDHINVLTFGAIRNGLTNTSPHINAASAYFTSNEIAGRLYIPYGEYLLQDRINVNEAINIYGDGWGGEGAAASQPESKSTTLISDNLLCAIRVVSLTQNEFIFGGSIKDLYIKGSNTTTVAIELRSTRHFKIDAGAERCIEAGLVINDQNGVLSANNTVDYFFYQSGSAVATESSEGISIYGIAAGAGTTRTRIVTANLLTNLGTGLVVGDHDAGDFGYISGSVLFRGDAGSQPRPSRKNCITFLNGIVTCEANSRNTILHINSEPSEVFLQGNAVLDYQVIDRNNGARFQTFKYYTDYQVELGVNALHISDSAEIGFYKGGGILAVRMPTAVLSTVTATIPKPRYMAKGVISKITALVVPDAVDGNVVLRGGAKSIDIGNGLGSPVDVVTITPTLVDNLNAYEIPLSTSTQLPDETKAVTTFLERDGTAGNDTSPTNIYLLGLVVHYEGAIWTDTKTFDSPPDFQEFA